MSPISLTWRPSLGSYHLENGARGQGGPSGENEGIGMRKGMQSCNEVDLVYDQEQSTFT